MIQLRKEISIGERLFGKFYEREDKTLFITEQDPFDIYFLFGILGLIILFVPLIYVLFSSLIICFKEIKNRFFDIKSIMCFLSIVLALGVSTMSGHTLLAPSVSTFMILILMAFYVRCREKKDIENKKSILIGSVHMEIGGIEKTLINLLKRIDYKKYKVDLLLLKPEGVLLKYLPQNVKIITPYGFIMKKIALSNNVICKVIKHLFFNYYTGGLFATNREYDVAISYSGYYPFIDSYIGSSYAYKKLIWLHTDIESNYKHDERYRKRFDRTKYKYDKFDSIVGVSEGVKESFERVLPEYKSKTTYMWNIIDFALNNDKSLVKLDGKFNIVCIGRLCQQKRFDKVIDVALSVSDDMKFYIVGGGELYDDLKTLIKSKDLDNKVILLGECSNVQSILKQVNLLLSVSDYEGLPTVLLESLICSVPIVATEVCGNKDIYKYIAPKGSMIICKNNVSSIVKALNKAYKGPKHKNIKFDLEQYNKENMDKFYKIIGE